MKPTPKGWPRISSVIYYDDAVAAIDWLCEAFGFEVRMKVEGDDGRIVHSELTFDEGLVMVAEAAVKAAGRKPMPSKSPRSLGGTNTQSLCVYVDDADDHCNQARLAGAKITDEPTTHDYGEDHWSDRTYRAEDLEGHQWWVIQRVRSSD